MAPAPPASLAEGRPLLALIVAAARNGVIGIDNRLPWRLPDDLRRFRTLTTGHAVIMGRRTFESIGRPLPGRQNIVVTRTPGYRAEGAEVVHSLAEALGRVSMPEPAFCIGGGELYRVALPRAALVHLTEIQQDIAGDTHFPPLDALAWEEMERTPAIHDDAQGIDYAFVTLRRRGPVAI